MSVLFLICQISPFTEIICVVKFMAFKYLWSHFTSFSGLCVKMGEISYLSFNLIVMG